MQYKFLHSNGEKNESVTRWEKVKNGLQVQLKGSLKLIFFYILSLLFQMINVFYTYLLLFSFKYLINSPFLKALLTYFSHYNVLFSDTTSSIHCHLKSISITVSFPLRNPPTLEHC